GDGPWVNPYGVMPAGEVSRPAWMFVDGNRLQEARGGDKPGHDRKALELLQAPDLVVEVVGDEGLHDLVDAVVAGEAQRPRAFGARLARPAGDDLLDRGIFLPFDRADAAVALVALHRLGHLAGGDADAAEQEGAVGAELVGRQVMGADEGVDGMTRREEIGRAHV